MEWIFAIISACTFFTQQCNTQIHRNNVVADNKTEKSNRVLGLKQAPFAKIYSRSKAQAVTTAFII